MKKKILLLCTFFISLFIFINRTGAVVMWMQCTKSPTDMLDCGDDCDTFGLYNTYAVINEINGYTRNLVYNPNDFYGGKKPVFVMADASSGKLEGKSCWFQTYYDDIEECEKNLDQTIPISNMLEGVCPVGLRQTDAEATGFGRVFGGGWIWGKVEKDFLVIYGTQSAFDKEVLNKDILVIYGFQKEDGTALDYMIEGYSASTGEYGYATTWKDWDEFEEKLDIYINDSDYDLVNENEYSKTHITWTAFTQSLRIAKLGRNYFKLLDSEESWLINAKDTSKLVKKETDNNGNSTIYRSDDKNGNFQNWAQNWYKDYSKELDGIISSLKELEKYTNLMETSRKMKEAVDEGKEYKFSGPYTASEMVEDLSETYTILKELLDKDKFTFKAVDESCNLTKEVDDPLTAMQPKFLCDVFGVNNLEKLENKTSEGMLGTIVASILSNKIQELSNSEYGIDDIANKKEEYLTLFSVASAYLNKNKNLLSYGLTSDETKKLETINNDYLELAGSEELEIIVDCEGLLGEDLINKINSYLNIIGIAIPIILIGFGIIDFTKAVFAGNEEQMKKAQKDFIKRLEIAILIFFVPTIVNLILSLANKVWNFIEPNSCGLFKNK